MLHGVGSSRKNRHTFHLVVAPFLELTSVDHSKPLGGLIKSYNEVVERGCCLTVSAALESSHEASSVVEDIYVELERLRVHACFDAFGQARGRLVPPFLSVRDQCREKDCPIAIDQYYNTFFTGLDSLN